MTEYRTIPRESTLTPINQKIKDINTGQINYKGVAVRPAGVIHREDKLNGLGIMVNASQPDVYKIEGIDFRATEAGSIIHNGARIITNACFYLAAVTAILPDEHKNELAVNACSLRELIIPRADELARKNSRDPKFTFGGDNVMAEIEVLYAFAEEVRPIMVIHSDTKSAQLITHAKWLSEPDLQPIFVLLQNHHYRPLIQVAN